MTDVGTVGFPLDHKYNFCFILMFILTQHQSLCLEGLCFCLLLCISRTGFILNVILSSILKDFIVTCFYLLPLWYSNSSISPSTLRCKHSTYNSHFLRFIASTSGLEALCLSRGVTLPHFPLSFSLRLALSLTLFLSVCPSSSPSSCVFLSPVCVNYLLYFVSELMSDFKRRMELDSK